MQTERLVMPTRVFVDAVHLAGEQCVRGSAGWNSTEHPAVKLLTDWWNETAAPAVQCAFAFSLYVRHGDGWLSGDPDEGWVTPLTWAKTVTPNAEAELLDGQIVIMFFQHSADESESSFVAKAVDGNQGCSGGKNPEATGDKLLTFFSYKALSLFAARFPEMWESACAATQPVKL